MLSVLGFIIILIASAWASAMLHVDQNRSMESAKARGYKIYYDEKGISYATDNGEKCVRQITSDGHTVFVGLKSYRLVWDVTQEKWDKQTEGKAFRVVAKDFSGEYTYLEKSTNRYYRVISLAPSTEGSFPTSVPSILIKYLDNGELRTITGDANRSAYWWV